MKREAGDKPGCPSIAASPWLVSPGRFAGPVPLCPGFARQDASPQCNAPSTCYLTISTVQNETFPCFLQCSSLAASCSLSPALSYSLQTHELIGSKQGGSARPASLCATKGAKTFLIFKIFISVNASKREELKSTARSGGEQWVHPRQFNPWVSVFVFHLLDR